MNLIDLIEHLCRRPLMWNSEIKTSKDLVAAICGFCLGLGDPEAEHCLSNFPKFFQSSLLEPKTESWYDLLVFSCRGYTFREAGDHIAAIIALWRRTNSILPPPLYAHIDNRNLIVDSETFLLMENVLRNPHSFIPKACTLREILAFLWGVTVVRWPQHGSIPGGSEFLTYACQHFRQKHSHLEVLLLTELEGVPFADARLLVATLIDNWLNSTH